MYYARLTVRKAQADMGRESGAGTGMRESERIDAGRSSLERGDGASNGGSAVAAAAGWSVTRKRAPRWDHLLGYAASLERIFDCTLTQLERLRRMPKGQAVPSDGHGRVIGTPGLLQFDEA